MLKTRKSTKRYQTYMYMHLKFVTAVFRVLHSNFTAHHFSTQFIRVSYKFYNYNTLIYVPYTYQNSSVFSQYIWGRMDLVVHDKILPLFQPNGAIFERPNTFCTCRQGINGLPFVHLSVSFMLLLHFWKGLKVRLLYAFWKHKNYTNYPLVHLLNNKLMTFSHLLHTTLQPFCILKDLLTEFLRVYIFSYILFVFCILLLF